MGGTRLSVLGEALLREERAQEFLLTRLLGLLPGESGWPRSVMSLLRQTKYYKGHRTHIIKGLKDFESVVQS